MLPRYPTLYMLPYFLVPFLLPFLPTDFVTLPTPYDIGNHRISSLSLMYYSAEHRSSLQIRGIFSYELWCR